MKMSTMVLLLLNKRKVFKEKYAAVALILLLVGFFQVPTVHARTTPLDFPYFAGVELTIPEDRDLVSVTGYITPRLADVSEGFSCYFLNVLSQSEWRDHIEAGYAIDLWVGETIFFIETFVSGYYDEIRALNVSFDETYRVHISVEEFEDLGKTVCSAFIYDESDNIKLKWENVDLGLGELSARALGESTSTSNEMEAEFSELKWSCLDGDGRWDGSDGFTCTVKEDYPYFAHMYFPYWNFLVSGGPGTKTLTILPCEGGTTYPEPGIYTYIYDKVVTVWADADNDYYFGHWGLDGKIYMQNPINITMDSSHRLEAYFSGSGPGGPPHPPRPLGDEI